MLSNKSDIHTNADTARRKCFIVALTAVILLTCPMYIHFSSFESTVGSIRPSDSAKGRQVNPSPLEAAIVNTTSAMSMNRLCSADAVILFDRIPSASKFAKVGGVEHWWHLFERIIPFLPEAVNHLWPRLGEVPHDPHITPVLQASHMRTMYFVFQDASMVPKMDPFGKLLVSTVFSGGHFDRLVFGNCIDCDNLPVPRNDHTGGEAFTSRVHNISLSMDSSVFRAVFEVDLTLQHPSDRFRNSHSTTAYPANVAIAASHCASQALRVPWYILSRHRFETFTSIQSFSSIQQSSARLCSANISSAGPQPFIETIPHVNMSEVIERRRNKFNKHYFKSLDTKQALVMAFNNSRQVPTYVPSKLLYTLLIYQRDSSRKIVDMSAVANHLRALLNQPHSYENNTKQPLQWKVVELIHSKKRSPCELLSIVGASDALLSAHGFQNTLLIFQPWKSVFAEIHPGYFSKPTLFGSMQMGIYANAGVDRFYLADESISSSWLVDAIVRSLHWLGYKSSHCLALSACRYIAKQQSVHVSDKFINRLAEYLRDVFPYQRTIQ